MLDKLTAGDFMPCLNQTFRLYYGPAEWLEVDLIEVAEAVADPNRAAHRRPFSLVFRGSGGGYLPQRIYRLEHEAFGALEIFVVPIGPDSQGMRYEAVFN